MAAAFTDGSCHAKMTWVLALTSVQHLFTAHAEVVQLSASLHIVRLKMTLPLTCDHFVKNDALLLHGCCVVYVVSHLPCAVSYVPCFIPVNLAY